MKIINTSILRICLLAFMMMPVWASAQSYYADVNCDGDVSISDVTDLIDILLGNNGATSGNGGSNRGVISVKDYGAVGDGVTDDTEAMERAFADAARLQVSLYVPSGTYIIRRPLTIKSGMEIYGDGANSIIKKTPAAWHKLTDKINKGVYNNDEYHTITLKVDGIDGYHVGDHCYISFSDNPFVPTYANSRARFCTFGEIYEINDTPIVEDSITKYEVKIRSAYDSVWHGTVSNHPAGATLSTSFPIMRSWSYKDECNDVYIHDLCLDGNRQTNGPTYNGVTYEPMEWTNGCIHFDASYKETVNPNTIPYNKHSYNHIIERCRLVNASFDGISDQGEGGLIVRDCEIENNAMHGIHLGTTFTDAVIRNNKMTGNGVRGAGVFFCQDATNVIVESNNISGFNHACSDEEYASAGKFIIIRDNTIDNITGYVFDFMAATATKRGGGLQIFDNTISKLKNSLFYGDHLDNLILANNMITSIAKTPSTLVIVISSNNAIITGNQIPSGASVPAYINSSNTTNLINAGNSWN